MCITVPGLRVRFYFFFASRRRHTRLQGDWSSDVCSSDLPLAVETREACLEAVEAEIRLEVALLDELEDGAAQPRALAPVAERPDERLRPERSEERRVGKEGRSRWSPYH